MKNSRHLTSRSNERGTDQTRGPWELSAPWSGKNNRRLNHALHIVAVTQIAHDCAGRRYYERKLTQGKMKKEALQALKLPTPMYRQLIADAKRQVGPGGQAGTTPETSVTGPTPTAGSSVTPQPGPGREVRPSAASA